MKFLLLFTVFCIVEVCYGIKCWENDLGGGKKENPNCTFCGYEQVHFQSTGDKTCDDNHVPDGEIRYCLKQSNFDYDTPIGKQNMNDTTGCVTPTLNCENYRLSICNWDDCNDKCQSIADAPTTKPPTTTSTTTTTTQAPQPTQTITQNDAQLITFSLLPFLFMTVMMLM